MNRTSLIVSLVVLSLTGCKKEEAKPAPAPAPVAAPAPAPTEPPKAAIDAVPAPTANTAPLEGALPYPFTQADSKLTWTGAKITGKHDGAFGVFGGIVELVGNDPTKSRVRAEIDTTSLTTAPEKLVAHLKSPDFFAVQEWPKATFVSTAIAKSGEAYTVTGDLTLHGVTKSITFPATINAAEPEVSVNAEFKINRKDFGIVYRGMPDDLISDDVAIKLDIHAKKKG